MRIAVLSGKGGAGKTLVAVNLAVAAEKAVYADCDVEEPNGHLFLKPKENESESVEVTIPVIDPEKCTACRQCVDFCRFNALAMIAGKVMLFDEICHSCGGCQLVCPEKAIHERKRSIGMVQSGHDGEIKVLTGILNTGEAAGVPIIKEILKKVPTEGNVFIDCPPGSACSVMESIQEADYCLLVAEPTIFGRDNLAMIHELVTLFDKPAGLLLNKVTDGENPSQMYGLEHNLPILGEIPYDRELSAVNAAGNIVSREIPKYKNFFRELLQRIEKEASHETNTGA